MIQFIDGNQAVVKGALKAGCDFFAGYPITPATQILVDMLKDLPAYGGVGIQAEDEIASIGFCIAAAMAGKKTMTATSGPGMSLYSENLGMAIAGETPLVIVNCQRFGPSTGSATKDASGDIQFVRWGTSGGYPIIALSPTNVSECYTLTIEAFNLAEKYRIPVVIMLSKDLAQTAETIDFSKIKKQKIIERKKFNEDGEFVPYVYDGGKTIANFCPYGEDQIVRYTSSSHKVDGYLATDKQSITSWVDHLANKIDGEKISYTNYDQDRDAMTLIISYGIVSRSAIDAVNELRKKNNKVSHLIIYSLWPVPEKSILDSLKDHKNIIIPEMNHGQYLQEIIKLTNDSHTIIPIQKVDTMLIPPESIISHYEEIK